MICTKNSKPLLKYTMNHASHFLAGSRSVIFTLLLVLALSSWASGQDFPTVAVLKSTRPLTQQESEQRQWTLINNRGSSLENRARLVTNIIFLMLLFGTFSALWAQNTGRNALLWFFVGAVLNFVAVAMILRLNPRKRKRRYRRTFNYWSLLHFT